MQAKHAQFSHTGFFMFKTLISNFGLKVKMRILTELLKLPRLS